MLPAGGHKGFGTGLLVEILAACLSGAVLSKDASPFSGALGGPPKTGQCFIAFDPSAFSGRAFRIRSQASSTRSRRRTAPVFPGAAVRRRASGTERDGVSGRCSALIDRIEALIR
jgi:(2R)-3-sulfolactate dehydrogenase (NADP+)